jgi:hypothetical protein
LYELLEYRINFRINVKGEPNTTVGMIFASDDIVSKIAKEMLLGHILDNKDELSTAYRQLDPLNRSPR